MIKLIILLLLAECGNQSTNTNNKKVEDREVLKKEKPLNKNKKDDSKNIEEDLTLTFDEIITNIKDRKLEEEQIKKFLEKNNTYFNDILNYSLIHSNTIALNFFLKNYNINDFDISLALEKYFESDDANNIYIDYIINYLKYKKSEFFNIFIDKVKILEDDNLVKLDNLVQKILKTSYLYGEDFKDIFKVSLEKVNEETLLVLDEKLLTKDEKLNAFKYFYQNSKDSKFFNSYLNVILNKNNIKDVLELILNDPLNENFDKSVSNDNFIELFKALNKGFSYEILKLINGRIKNYLENSYEKAERIVEIFASKKLLKLEDFEFKRLYKEIQNKENFERLFEFCFVSKVPERNLEKSWYEYIKLNMDENLNFKLFKKFYEKSSEKTKFLSNTISKITYSSFELKVLNFAFEQNIPFDDKSLVIIFKNILSFLRDEKELNSSYLEVAEKTLDKILSFNSIYNNNRVGEEIILSLFSWLVLGDNNKLNNKDQIKSFLNRIVKIYLDKSVQLSPAYQGYFEKIKEKFLIK